MRGEAKELAKIQRRFQHGCPHSIVNLIARDIFSSSGNMRVVPLLPDSLLNAFVVRAESSLIKALNAALAPWNTRWPEMFSKLRLQVFRVESDCVLSSAPRPKTQGTLMDTVSSASWWTEACKKVEGSKMLDHAPEGTTTLGLPWALVMKTTSTISGTTAIPGNGTGTWVLH